MTDMYENATRALEAAKRIQMHADLLTKPPAEGTKPATDRIIDTALVRGAPGNFVRVVDQINGTYERGWYDACAIMLRRLLEMLIIEAYVANGMKDKIKAQNGRFLRLNGLISRACHESSWALDDNGAILRKLSAMGNWSAHKRRYVANREDIDQHVSELRIVVQELVFLAKLK